MNSGKKEVQDLTINWISRLNLSESQNYLIAHEKKIESPDKSPLRKLIDRFNLKKSDISSVFILNLARSENPDDRLKAITAILKEPHSVKPQHLLPLLRDYDYRVKVSTIRAIGKLKMPELAPGLIDLLEDDYSYPFAFNSLEKMGADIMEKLEQGFYRTGITEKGMLRIIRLMALSKHPGTGKILMNMMDTSGIAVKSAILKNLLKISWVADETAQNRLFQLMHDICAVTAWNIAAGFSAKESLLNEELNTAFNEELEENYEIIFDILSLVYDAQLIYHIRKNLESGTSEGVGFAIELLDMFVDENIKPFLFPLLEDSPAMSKIQRLQSEFPVEVQKPAELINSILNRDYNKLSRFVKITALSCIEKLEHYQIGQDIIAQLFNPDDETAFAAAEPLILIDFTIFDELSERLPAARYEKIMQHMAAKQAGKPAGVYERYRILRDSSVLGVMRNKCLFRLALHFRSIVLNQGEYLADAGNSQEELLIFIYKGSLEFFRNDKVLQIQEGIFFRHKDILNLYGKEARLTSGTETFLLCLEERILKEYIFDDEFNYIQILNLIEDIETISGAEKQESNK